MMRAGREARCHIEFRMLTIWEPLLYNINRIYSRSPQLQVRSGLLVCNREGTRGNRNQESAKSLMFNSKGFSWTRALQ